VSPVGELSEVTVDGRLETTRGLVVGDLHGPPT
jgi:hypothetical protein